MCLSEGGYVCVSMLWVRWADMLNDGASKTDKQGGVGTVNKE